MARRRPTTFQPARLLAWLTVLAGLVGAIAVYRIYLAEARRDVRQRTETELQPYGRALEGAIARRLALLEGLRAFVEAEQQSRNLREGFRVFAFGLMASADGLRSLQLIEGGVIRYVFPDVEGGSLEGYDLRSHPESDLYRLVEDAIATDSLRLLGPFHRASGSFRMTAIRAFASPSGQPVGAVAAVLELDEILVDAGFSSTAGMRVALRDQRDSLLLGDPEVATLDPVTFTVQVLPDKAWTLAAVPEGGWAGALPQHTGVVGVVAFLFALLIAALAWLVADRQQTLSAAVEQRTRSLRGANQELQRQIAVRQQVEAQLLQSQKMEGMGRLAGGIAHDFNNLLTAIIGYTTLIRGGLRPGDPIEEDVAEVEKASRRAADLTRQLLAFARKQVVKPRAVRVDDLVSELHRMLERLLGPDITLVTEVARDLRPVRADPGQLEQAITNLVVNARDAMPEGGTVTVRASNLDVPAGEQTRWDVPPGPYVRLDVTDEGVGMDAATISRIFEPFFTTKDHGKGTGLGLATTYGIVRQAGGSIGVESTPGQGSTFSMVLPCTSEAPEAVVPAGTVTGASEGAETVLVVDDEAVVIDVAERALSRRGYRVFTAIDPAEAIARYAAMAPQVAALVTDLQMPGVSGEALAATMRETHPTLRVLYMSGRAEPDGGLPAGSAFLAKPFTPDQLTDAVRDLLDDEIPA